MNSPKNAAPAQPKAARPYERWQFRQLFARSKRPAWEVIETTDGHPVASVWQDGGMTLSPVIAESRARLIAAAPETAAERDHLKTVNTELLAALVKLTVIMQKGGNTCYTASTGNFMQEARAAIAKAGGAS